MSCHARLGNFGEARSHLISARGFYADHLALPEQQRARFLQDGCFIDDLQAVGNRDLQENPWLYFILGHSYGPLLYEADSKGESWNAALRGWAEFVSDNRERMFGALAYLYFSNGKYAEAAKYLERVLLIARRYHAVLPVRIELVWPRVILGDCYWVSHRKEEAAATWRIAATVELCVSMEPNIDDWERFALPWIEKAKSRLTEHSIPVPAPEVSRKASEHLRQAIEHIFEAEQFEAQGVDLEELSAMVRQAGKRYTAAIEHAASELELVERLDPFTWAKSPHERISYWYTYENAKGAVLQKRAIAHLADDELALTVAALKEAMSVWPVASLYALLAGLLASCGLIADARATYQTCIERVEEFGAVDSVDRHEILLGIQEGLSLLPG